ncbi:hypothetical protein ACLB1Q_28040 [Escherichia coli]
MLNSYRSTNWKLSNVTGYTKGKELKILGAIGEGKAPTSVPSAASCALEEILRQGREMIQWSSPKPQNGDWHIGRGVAIIMQKSGIPDIGSG